MIVITPELLAAFGLLLSGLGAVIWSIRRKP